MLKDNESTATTLHSERKLNERTYVWNGNNTPLFIQTCAFYRRQLLKRQIDSSVFDCSHCTSDYQPRLSCSPHSYFIDVFIILVENWRYANDWKKNTFLVRFDIFVRFDIPTVLKSPTFWICTFFSIFVWNRSVWMTFKSNWVWNTFGSTCLRIFDIYDFWSKKISKQKTEFFI